MRLRSKQTYQATNVALLEADSATAAAATFVVVVAAKKSLTIPFRIVLFSSVPVPDL